MYMFQCADRLQACMGKLEVAHAASNLIPGMLAIALSPAVMARPQKTRILSVPTSVNHLLQLDAGLVPDEDAGKAFCKELALRLTGRGGAAGGAGGAGGGGSAAPAPDRQAATRKLDQAVGLGAAGDRKLTDEVARMHLVGGSLDTGISGIGSRATLVVDHTQVSNRILRWLSVRVGATYIAMK